MTVEQNVLQQSAAQKHQQTFLNQLREITGINDAQILQQALKDSNGNLELAVAFLTAKNAKTPQQEETTYYQTALPGRDRYISVGSQADARCSPGKDCVSLSLLSSLHWSVTISQSFLVFLDCGSPEECSQCFSPTTCLAPNKESEQNICVCLLFQPLR
ncbi:ubiquitin carboxyl-terminal hydrolase 25-like isoform X4 [Equus caballus]|uniref:ubiquitin carboxyl-terminal hydrolase 25-like isoform X4 n=1 Tax=Equus caballus TaxID=9796 RepID=UPI0038B3003A